MGWLRDLLLGKDDDPPPSYGAAQEVPDPIDWVDLEDRLVELSVDAISHFAESHKSESFYGLAFDCDSGEGQVLLCLNTRIAQAKAAVPVEGPFLEIQLAMTEAERLASAEWGLGDWKYQGFNIRAKAWKLGWRPCQAKVAESIGMLTLNSRHKQANEVRESFMQATCRALRRVADSERIGALRRDPDFSILSVDHDESPDAGRARLSSVLAGAS